MPNVTKHGEDRLRKRLNIKKSSVDKEFANVLAKGHQHNEFKGNFKRYLDRKAMFYHAKPIIFGQNIYWTSHDTLITVYPVPAMYRKYLK